MDLRKRFYRVHRTVRKFLQERQFAARGQVFWYRTEQLCRVVILKRSRWNTRSECEFWLELGIFIPGFFPLLWEKQDPPYPQEDFLAVSLRIDNIPLRPPQRETVSWYLRADDPLPQADSQIEKEILFELEKYLVPFLDRFNNLFDVIDYLKWVRTHGNQWFKWTQILPNDVWLPVYLAVLYWMVGEGALCLQELEDASKNEEAGICFLTKVADLKKRLF
jgi:hypothetical protein